MEKYDLRENMMELPGSPSYPADTKMETMENVSGMDEEQLRKLKTECAIAEKKVEQSQLIDRIATNTFQG